MAGITIASKSTVAVLLTAASQSPLTILASGSIYPGIGGYAVEDAAGVISSITNLGQIGSFTNGVQIDGALALVNGAPGDTLATIKAGFAGVYVGANARALLTNFGTISGTFPAYNSGDSYGVLSNTQPLSIINGTEADTKALISGATNGIYAGAGLNLANFGAIASAMGQTKFRAGAETAIVAFGHAGIVNGSATDTAASITGSYVGLHLFGEHGFIANFGTISAHDSAVFANFTPVGQAVLLGEGGTVVNGSPGDVRAQIAGSRAGVQISQQAGFVTNFGTIAGTDARYGGGIVLGAGGSITNGGLADTAAAIQAGGGIGVDIAGARPSSLANYGTISATGGVGVALQAGGVVNGAAADTKARIAGYGGVYALAASSVTNYGTIAGTASSGITLLAGGTVTNAPSGSIGGGGPGAGVSIYSGAATVINAGTIAGAVGVGFAVGVALSAGGTVVNSGLIASSAGASGTALQFGAGPERLVIAPSGRFTGRVVGGSGTNVIELAAGGAGGSISGIGSQFTGFGGVTVDAGGHWAIDGSTTLADLVDNGALIVTGSLDVGSLDAATTAPIMLGANTTLEVSSVIGNGPAIEFLYKDTLTFDASANFATNGSGYGYSGPLLEGFGAGDSIDLKGIPLTGIPLGYDSAGYLLIDFSAARGAMDTLRFQTTSLGSGVFHAMADGSGGTLITHS